MISPLLAVIVMFLHCESKGESMINEGMLDGDIVLVRKQETAKDGDIVVALIDGDATVKTFFRERNRIRLQPANDSMRPICRF